MIRSLFVAAVLSGAAGGLELSDYRATGCVLHGCERDRL
jgi:hypothetical protein